MKRDELIRLLVLVEIADDYEEPGHIFENVARRAELCRVSVVPADIRKALVDLVQSGLARAYQLSTRGPAEEMHSTPPLDRVQDYYFWTTEGGKVAIDSSRKTGQWPFDDEGFLMAGWPRSIE